MMPRDESAPTLYERVGGHETFATIVHQFFELAKDDPELSKVYPAHDWDGAENRLLLFLAQYWGGPMTYSLTRGAPMLRMRHMPYRVTRRGAERWASCMHDAIASVEMDPADAAAIGEYTDRAAMFLINADD